MKIILNICAIILIAMALYGCDQQKTPTIDVETPIESTPTEPIETIDPVPGFLVEVVGSETVSHISSDDFAQMSLSEIEDASSQLESKVFVGFRLVVWFKNDTAAPEGWTIEGENGMMHVAKDLNTIYIIVGEKSDGEINFYTSEDIYLARYNQKKIIDKIANLQSIKVRHMDPDQAIYYINFSSITGRYDYHTSLRAMQGIINRYQPRLLTITQSNAYYKHTDETWLNVLEEQGYDLIELTSIEEVIYTFKDHFNGIITFKDRFKSYNNWVSGESDFALMMASVMDYAPIPHGIHQTLSTLTQLPLIESFELNGNQVNGNISNYLDSKNVTSAYDAYALVFQEFRQVFNTASYMSLTSEAMDYAASEKMMFFDLKATQNERDNMLSKQINAYFSQNNDYFQVYGWVDHESSALDFISSYGGIIDVVGSGNLSLLARLDSQTQTFKQKTLDTAVYDSQKKYVTFFASESDTIKVAMAFQHGAWLDPNRGKVKINWGFISDMSVEFPFVYEHFINSATHNDYFYSGGGSAIGFVDIDSQMHYKSREAIADANAYYMSIADQQYIDMYNDKYTSTDLFEKSVLGSYLFRSQVDGAFARIHDGNTSIRIEKWSSVPVYNRWTNFYPRRSSSGDVSYSSMTEVNHNQYVQTKASDYWFIQSTLANSEQKIIYDLFRQHNGDGYHVRFENGAIFIEKTVSGITSELASRIYTTTSRNIKISIDKSTPLDEFTRIKLYINDLLIFDYYDTNNSFISGGFGIRTVESTRNIVTSLDGTIMSMAKQIYQRIITDPNHYILAYYGFVGTEDYTLAQYRSEPGVGGVISLSPTDFYKIQLLLDQNYPGVYEVVNAREFMTFATTYQQTYGTLR